MNRHNRLAALLVCIWMTALLAVPAGAEGAIEEEKPVSLTLWAHYGNRNLAGVEFQLCRVCSVDTYGELTPVEAFSPFSGILDIRGENARAWEKAARVLAQYVRWKGIVPTAAAVTNGNGVACFPTGDMPLPQGLYLVLGTVHQQDGWEYTTAPFLIQLPGRDPVSNDWDYAVDAEAKATGTAIPGTLAQTGQLRWPVWVLAGAGAMLMAVGLAERKKKH